MRIAVVHYHLQSGGVTRIIQNSLPLSGKEECSLVILTGQAPHDKWPCLYRVIPGLQYEGVGPKLSPSALADEMIREAEEALGGLPDVWHVHNHSLGKNMALPGALALLAAKGHHLFLHVHDFAEDGRPGNYRQMLAELGGGEVSKLSKVLYPTGSHVHYGVLNRRDYNFFQQAGLGEEQLHLLPNPIELALDLDISCNQVVSNSGLWLYPTRGIRRKNLGEFLLWAAASTEGESFATSLAPLNPKELSVYNGWKKLAAELCLPIEFERASSEPGGFIGLMKRARGLVTTSVAEGFGLAFLEPWLMGKVVCGRDLPEITQEFREEGIHLSYLYERLEVPVDWLGKNRIMDKAAAGLAHNLASYGRQSVPGDLERVENSWIRDGHVDFGRLDEELQEVVIRKVRRSPFECRHLAPSSLDHPVDFQSDVLKNRQVLAECYGVEAYHHKLRGIYEVVAGSLMSPVSSLDGEMLLDCYLQPERLNLLRID
ncbi:MAG: hypothetical protein OEM02_09920 [Desulfobulbaceae bacterium]|nr:hypothetical protein [Desulfobulbaceae bacterium]